MNHRKSRSKARAIFTVLISVFYLSFPGTLCSEDKLSSGELIVKAWQSHGKKDIEDTFKYTEQIIAVYTEEADRLQASLTSLPKGKEEIARVSVLNDVATAYFIRGESFRYQGKIKEAVGAFKTVIYKYCYAQAWDPRGWFWSVAKASWESVVQLDPDEPLLSIPCAGISVTKEPKPLVSQIPAKIILHDPGKEDFVDYEKYGKFQHVGAKDYKYTVTDQEGLMRAVGEGVYPNGLSSIRRNPEFQRALREKRLDGDLWEFLRSPDLQAAFFKWAVSSELQGVKLFYIGSILEKSGLITHAIKCYYAIVVHFPASYGLTYWGTPWYVGQAALSRIHFLLHKNPQLDYRLDGADIYVINGFDHDLSNDIVITSPGKWVKISSSKQPKAKKPPRLKQRLSEGEVRLLQHRSGDWQLIVDNKPYVIRAITYTPTKVCQSPDEGTMGNWMEEDFNQNGNIDGPYDAFVDKNRNNIQDEDEPAVGDFKLMQEMGVNTIRLYHHPHRVNKPLLRDLYKRYGIRVIMGDFLGKYALGSGAPWDPGTDYNNEEHRKNMLDSITKMALEHKDEPYILFWLLGNENVYGYGCNADKEPDAFFRFANEAAKLIKSLAPLHPVAICSGDILFLDKFSKYCPDIDIFGTNAYRGNAGFGYLWRQVKRETGKPVFITEFGCPAYAGGKPVEEAEQLQAEYHQNSWEDIELNAAFGIGAGNAIGAVVFEWLDEWWKAYESCQHDTRPLWPGPFPDGYMYEEWLGLCGQGDGRLSPFLRQLRESYYMYKEAWVKRGHTYLR